MVLLILAGVTITALLGDDGIIKKAQNAADSTNSAVQDELAGMNSLTDKMNSILNGNGGGGDTFEPQPTPEPPTGGTAMEDMTNGIIEIKWLSGTSDRVSESPNAPAIKTDFTDGTMMEQVVFNGTDWEPGTEYSYVAGTGTSDNTSSEWANARVIKDGIESYFVWIPRYAYRIIYFDSSTSKQAYQNGELTEEKGITGGQIIGYSDSRGIVDAQGRKIDGVASTTKTMVSEDYFMVHPAFTADADLGGGFGNDNGTNDNGISGIWIGKYEASLANKTDGTNIVTNDEETGDILLSDAEHAEKTIVTKPGYSSWRNIQIVNMYDNAKAYNTDLKSHMLKNSEWGAVAYLTESKYGRNGTEVTINNNGTTYYTGGGAEKAYIENTPQSSTGNVYGIYDLSENATEYVVAGYKNQSSIGTSSGSNEYGTVYTDTSASTGYKYGDATYETSGWHSDLALFVDSYGPFFSRGGVCGDGDLAGVFNCYVVGNGYGNGYSFRLALVL